MIPNQKIEPPLRPPLTHSDGHAILRPNQGQRRKERVLSKPGKHTPYFELVDALGQAGCPVCRLAERSAERYLDGLLYEAVLDPAVRTRLRRSRGFCREHTAMLRRVPGRALGIALIYRDIIRDVIAATEALHERPKASWLSRLLRRKGGGMAGIRTATAPPCPACVSSRDAEARHIDTLLAHLDDETLYTAYIRSDGLCLSHLLTAVARPMDDTALRRLLDPQNARYRRLLHDLNEFIRKRDHRFRHEPYGEEGDAWLRAMSLMAGGESGSVATDRRQANHTGENPTEQGE